MLKYQGLLSKISTVICSTISTPWYRFRALLLSLASTLHCPQACAFPHPVTSPQAFSPSLNQLFISNQATFLLCFLPFCSLSNLALASRIPKVA